MRNRYLTAVLLAALPVSTILVGCDSGEDTDRAALEKEALERELELALQPDTSVVPELADVPLPQPEEEDPAAPPQAAPTPEPAPRRPALQPRATPEPARAPERTPEAAPRPEPAPTPAPSRPRVVTVPVQAGATLAVRVNQELSTRSSTAGSTFTATLAEPVVGPDGTTLIPAGATLHGRVTESRKSGNAGQQAYLEVGFGSISFDGRTYPVDATTLDAEAKLVSRSGTAGKAAKIGGGAALGAVLGQVLGKNSKSTVAGAAIGAAAGTAVAMGTDDVDAVIPTGTRVTLRLDSPLAVQRDVD